MGVPSLDGAQSALQASKAVGLENPDVAAPGCARTTLENLGMADEPFVELDKRLEAATVAVETPGLSYAVLVDGRLVRARCFGVADLEVGRPWRFDTICRLYSMTKAVTCCGLMMLVEQGRLSLDDPVSKFLPAFGTMKVTQSSPNGERTECEPRGPLTLKHLLTHTSGLAYGAALGSPPSCPEEESYVTLMKRADAGELSLAEWCDELAAITLHFQPGSHWEYSYGIDVVGRIIEVVSGQPLDIFLDERILRPLGMIDTGFSIPVQKEKRLATFYGRAEEGSESHQAGLEVLDRSGDSRWVAPRQHRVCSGGGTVGSVAGGLVSTLNDFVRLCLMLQRGGELDGVRLLKPETIQTMSANLLPEITGNHESWCLETPGLGFGVLGSVAVSHPGANWFDAPGEVGWGGLAGTAWVVDADAKLVVVSFTQVVYELWIDEDLRKAVRSSLAGRGMPASPMSPSSPTAVTDPGEGSETTPIATPNKRSAERQDSEPESSEKRLRQCDGRSAPKVLEQELKWCAPEVPSHSCREFNLMTEVVVARSVPAI